MQYHEPNTNSKYYEPTINSNYINDCYENDNDNKMHGILDYSKISHVGIKEVLNVIEIVGFDRSRLSLDWKDITYAGRVMPWSKFLKMYGKDLPQISKELNDRGIYIIPSLFGNKIILYKKKTGEFNDEYKSFFYESQEEIKDKLPYDVLEMSKQGFAMGYFRPMESNDKYMGHIATFIKYFN